MEVPTNNEPQSQVEHITIEEFMDAERRFGQLQENPNRYKSRPAYEEVKIGGDNISLVGIELQDLGEIYDHTDSRLNHFVLRRAPIIFEILGTLNSMPLTIAKRVASTSATSNERSVTYLYFINPDGSVSLYTKLGGKDGYVSTSKIKSGPKNK